MRKQRFDVVCVTCGKTFDVPLCRIKAGVKACSRKCRPPRFKHGGVGTRLYSIWHSMKCRCLTKSNTKYEFYGGRGITVCDEWLDFSAFREWAESSGYAEPLEIDRINPDLGYSPDNCRWATRTENNRNTRKKKSGKSSIYKGFFFNKVSRKWRTTIKENGRTKYIGEFPTEIEAARAYDSEARRVFGEFAYLNFPEGDTTSCRM